MEEDYLLSSYQQKDFSCMITGFTSDIIENIEYASIFSSYCKKLNIKPLFIRDDDCNIHFFIDDEEGGYLTTDDKYYSEFRPCNILIDLLNRSRQKEMETIGMIVFEYADYIQLKKCLKKTDYCNWGDLYETEVLRYVDGTVLYCFYCDCFQI
jgi:hypothetical protein